MFRKLLPLTLFISLTVAPLAVLSPASAAATTGTFFFQDTEVNPVDGTECVDNVGPGVETADFTTSGHFTATSTGFHVEGTGTIDSTTVFTNGFHITAHGQAHFSFNTNSATGQTVSTSGGGTEIHTVFDAQDHVVARVRFLDVFHTTFRDLNGDGQPDAGEVTTSFEHFHFICS